MTTRRIEILGVPVDALGWESVLKEAEAMLEGSTLRNTILAVNPEKIMSARRDMALLRRLRSATLLIPDGIGVVWAAAILGLGRLQRVPGSELMPKLCALAERKGYSVYLFGADPASNFRAGAELQRRFPKLRIAGQHDGYVSEVDMPSLVSAINAAEPDILFVALGSPRQELWMEQHLAKINAKLCQGVGGTFDVLAGKVRRAPGLFLRLNLEWLYRVLTNPRRIGRQVALPAFAWTVLAARFRGSPSADVSSR